MSVAWKTGLLAGILTFVVLFVLNVLFPDLPPLLEFSIDAMIAFLAIVIAYTVFGQKDS